MPWEFPTALSPRDFAALRKRTIFECCKWDPQVGDLSSLAPYPVVLRECAWTAIAEAARLLYHETLALEAALLQAPHLWARLSVPRGVCGALRGAGRVVPALARVMRFDFHFTTEGWRVSEVNSDVPGGFIETSGFARLMAEHFSDLHIPGDPTAAVVEPIAARCGGGANVGLVHATAYTDDRQVMIYFARALAARGVVPLLISPADIIWRAGHAAARAGRGELPLDAVLRFFPAEWLPHLPYDSRWSHFFAGTCTPQTNPGAALLTQSKRVPLVWHTLDVPTPTWRRWLPETCDPRTVDWRRGGWVLKPALGRVGESVAVPGVTPERDLRRIARWVSWRPSQWVAQRQFQALPMSSPTGPVYPCVGVFVVNGQVAGAYGRLASRALIDDQAQDAAVLCRPAVASKARRGPQPGEALHAAAGSV